MKKIAQIFSGGWHNQLYSSEKIICRLEEVLSIISLDAVIIGWNLDESLYIPIVKFLHSNGIEAYLWLHIFSEISQLGEADASYNILGKKTEIFKLQEGESFEFICPSSQKNQDLVLSIYQDYFSKCGFDGVFMDKIRSQSFIAGPWDVLSCSCNKCLKTYEANGFNLREFSDEISIKGIENIFEISSFSSDGNFIFTNKSVQNFFDIKQRLFTKAIVNIGNRFKEKGLKIGMDVFAPSFAPLVGQNIKELGTIAEFIKPMMYRKTTAPAGISFEFNSMAKSLGKHSNIKEKAPQLNSAPMDRDLFINQLKVTNKETGGKIFAGIEFNYREDIAQTSPMYINESISCLKEANCKGIVLSWDIMLASNEHIELLDKK